MREFNETLENRCKDLEKSIENIQPKYQEALNDRGRFEHDNHLIKLRDDRLQKALDSKSAEIVRLQEKTAALEDELITVESALRTSAVPEVRELAAMREELAKSKRETEREHHLYLNANQEIEYLRSTFQDASSSAVEHAAEKRKLEAELKAYRENAGFDKVRIHEVQTSNEKAKLRQENTQMRAQLCDLKRDYDKLQEEFKNVSNGRRGTRGASVPQSPRMGNQMQNSPARPIGRILQESRGNSPAPVDARGPAVGQFGGGTFGDALFPGPIPPPRERWGNHLQ